MPYLAYKHKYPNDCEILYSKKREQEIKMGALRRSPFLFERGRFVEEGIYLIKQEC